jgi:signal transduction histidine kinase
MFSLRLNPDYLLGTTAYFYGTAVMLVLMLITTVLSKYFASKPQFIYLQFVVDAIFVSFMLGIGTSYQNPFVVLYSINILAATALSSPKRVLFVTIMDVCLYIFVQALGTTGFLDWQSLENPLAIYIKVVAEVFGLFLIGGLSMVLSIQRSLISKVLREETTKNIEFRQQHVDILNELPLAIFLRTDRLEPKNKLAEEAMQILDTDKFGMLNKERTLFQDPDSGKEFEVTKTTLKSDIDLFLLKDVTNIKEMERMVAQEERLAMIGRLTSSLAHEIRNPLASLSGAVQLLAERDESRLHRIILQEIKRINELVDVYLQTARPKTMKRERQLIEPMIFDIVDALNYDPRSKNIEFSLKLVQRERLWVDLGQIRQIVWNLLLNAIQAMPSGGTIIISNSVEFKKYHLSIKDNGKGMTKEVINKIFDPFFTTRSGGTGLGLALVEQIIRAHGGTIQVQSEINMGTELILTFPIEKELG